MRHRDFTGQKTFSHSGDAAWYYSYGNFPGESSLSTGFEHRDSLVSWCFAVGNSDALCRQIKPEIGPPRSTH